MHRFQEFGAGLVVALLLLVESTAMATPAAADPPPAAAKFERRCGWLENPTPANVTLTDRDGAWDIGVQGGHQAEGDWSPTFGPGQWVATNGSHGYGCACLSIKADQATHEVIAVQDPKARPLAACRADKTLLDKPWEERAREPHASFHGMGFSFSYPSHWRLHHVGDCVQLDAPDKQKSEEYTVNICSKHAALERTAQDELIFSPDEHGVWMRSAGMDPPSPVEMLRGSGWKGMLATQTCGVSDEETGFHAAGGECLMAAVSDGKTSLAFDTVGFYQDFGEIRAIIDSVRFDAAASR